MAITINGTGSISGLSATGISAQPVFAGNIVQVKNYQTGAVDTTTTTLPYDDTIPQNTEGKEFMSLAITPTNANNKLLISIKVQLGSSVANWLTGALFQDSTASALSASSQYLDTANAATTFSFDYYMTAGTTSATTFKFRAGGAGAGTTTFNGDQGLRKMGGVMASSITIMEIAA